MAKAIRIAKMSTIWVFESGEVDEPDVDVVTSLSSPSPLTRLTSSGGGVDVEEVEVEVDVVEEVEEVAARRRRWAAS